MTDRSSDIPIDSLTRYLSQHVEGLRGSCVLTKFPTGQSNPTFHLVTESGEYVLRRKPSGQLLKSAHAIDREYRILSALRDSDVPVPRPLHYCSEAEVIGAEFYLMEFVRGRQYSDPTLPGCSNGVRIAIYDAMNRTLASLQAVDLEAVGLTNYGPPGGYFERQIRRWTQQYRAAETEKRPSMEELIEWLGSNVPPEVGRVSLVHGDYRLDNMIFSDDGTQVVALIDWELSTLGHPCADVAYQCAQWRLPPGILRGLSGVDRSLLGIPTEEDYLRQLCGRLDTRPPTASEWKFYLAVSLFRFASICQGVYKRGLEGNASSSIALEFGAGTAAILSIAVDIIRN